MQKGGSIGQGCKSRERNNSSCSFTVKLASGKKCLLFYIIYGIFLVVVSGVLAVAKAHE